MKKLKEIIDGLKQGTKNPIRKVQMATVAGIGFYNMKSIVNAGFARNAMTTMTSEAQWIGWGVLAVILIPLLLKRNWVAVVITGVFGAATVVLISNPTMLQTIGNYIVTAIFGA